MKGAAPNSSWSLSPAVARGAITDSGSSQKQDQARPAGTRTGWLGQGRRIQGAPAQQRLQLVGQTGGQADPQVRVPVAQTAERQGQVARDDGRHRTQIEHAGQGLSVLPVDQLLPLGHHLAGPADEELTLRGQPGRPCRAIEELQAELLLQRLNLQTDARGRQPDRPSGGREAAMVDDRDQGVERLDVHQRACSIRLCQAQLMPDASHDNLACNEWI
jgi:hypothetical protein